MAGSHDALSADHAAWGGGESGRGGGAMGTAVAGERGGGPRCGDGRVPPPPRGVATVGAVRYYRRRHRHRRRRSLLPPLRHPLLATAPQRPGSP